MFCAAAIRSTLGFRRFGDIIRRGRNRVAWSGAGVGRGANRWIEAVGADGVGQPIRLVGDGPRRLGQNCNRCITHYGR